MASLEAGVKKADHGVPSKDFTTALVAYAGHAGVKKELESARSQLAETCDVIVAQVIRQMKERTDGWASFLRRREYREVVHMFYVKLDGDTASSATLHGLDAVSRYLEKVCGMHICPEWKHQGVDRNGEVRDDVMFFYVQLPLP